VITEKVSEAMKYTFKEVWLTSYACVILFMPRKLFCCCLLV